MKFRAVFHRIQRLSLMEFVFIKRGALLYRRAQTSLELNYATIEDQSQLWRYWTTYKESPDRTIRRVLLSQSLELQRRLEGRKTPHALKGRHVWKGLRYYSYDISTP